MKRNQLIVLSLCFIAMVAAWYFVQQPKRNSATDLYSQVTGSFETSAIDSIEARVLSHPENTLRLSRTKAGWQIALKKGGEEFPAPAKKAKVERLLGLLEGLQGEFRAEGRDLLSTFGLEKGHGLEIRLKKDGKDLVAIVAGMKGPDWGSTFVRQEGFDRVYLVNRDIFSVFDIWSRKPDKALSLEPWVDLDVISAFPDSVKTCSYKSGERSWSISGPEPEKEQKKGVKGQAGSKKASPEGKSKGKEAWSFETRGKVVEKSWEEVRKYLSPVLPLRARDVEPPSVAGKAGLAPGQKASAVFTCRLKSGAEQRVEIGSCDEKDKTCLVRARGYIYRVDSAWKEKLEKPFSTEGKKGRKEPAKKLTGSNYTDK